MLGRNLPPECQLTLLRAVSIIQHAGIPLKERQKSLELALEEAVSRALRDNLAPLQRTADELHQAYADLVAACSSSRPSNALPAMLRAQTAASALAAGLSVLSNFVAVALNPRDNLYSDELPLSKASAVAVEEPADIPEVPQLGRCRARCDCRGRRIGVGRGRRRSSRNPGKRADTSPGNRSAANCHR